METLLGGLDLSVSFIDGTGESVRIRQLPIKLLPAYAQALTSEPAMVELFCDRPRGWSDLLVPSSFERLIEEGERINADFFGRWQERQKRREAMLPKRDPEELVAMFNALQASQPQLVAQLLSQAGLPSLTPLPSSPSIAGSPSPRPASIPSPS